MGCDIHIFYQIVNKKFKRVSKINKILDIEDNIIDYKEIPEAWIYLEDDNIDDVYKTNYGIFSDEYRNYYWFGRMSGVRTQHKEDNICHDFLPNGVTVKDLDDNGNYGEHSYGHVYLDELIDINWSKLDLDRMSTFINDDITRMTNYCDDNNLKYDEFRLLVSYDS